MNPIECVGIKKSYGSNLVLNDLNLVMTPGKVFGMVGLNGIGKTTIIKCILNLAKPDSGSIKIYGKSPSDKDAMKQLCYLPERFNPNPLLTGEEFIRIYLKMHSQAYEEEEVQKTCSELDFDPSKLKLTMNKYSKGMGQKVGLIATFLTKVQLLILDEPMTGLDPRARIFLKRKIAQARSMGQSIFFSSHILSDIEEVCDEIAVLDNGAIRYTGSASEFISNYNAKNLEDAFLKIIFY